jgi:hypothetical protein
MGLEAVTRAAPSHWRPLSRSEARTLDRLTDRNVRLLSASELVELGKLAGWALNCGDDGEFLMDEDGAEVERPDLSPEQRQWLRAVIRGVDHELNRRYREGGDHWPAPTTETYSTATIVPLRARIVARPREHRARRVRSRARSPGRSDDDPHEPAPALAGSRLISAGGGS